MTLSHMAMALALGATDEHRKASADAKRAVRQQLVEVLDNPDASEEERESARRQLEQLERGSVRVIHVSPDDVSAISNALPPIPDAARQRALSAVQMELLEAGMAKRAYRQKLPRPEDVNASRASQARMEAAEAKRRRRAEKLLK